MTIGSTSSAQMMMATSGTSSRQAQSLTDAQLETISSVLANYDSENLSQDDAQSIVESFKEAGIEPGSALESAMKEEGFDAKEVGDLAGMGGPGGPGGGMPPPPPQNEELEDSVSTLLEELFSTDDEDEDTTSSLVSNFDNVMEYTSRILSLNEKSQNEALNVLNDISNIDGDYSSEDMSNIVKNSLSQILSDNNNYRHVSFYA